VAEGLKSDFLVKTPTPAEVKEEIKLARAARKTDEKIAKARRGFPPPRI